MNFDSENSLSQPAVDKEKDDVYVRTLRLNLDYLQAPAIKELFGEDACGVFDRCGADLSDAALQILSRLTARRQGWLRSLSLPKYFNRYYFSCHSDAFTEEEKLLSEEDLGIDLVSKALNDLKDAGLIDILFENEILQVDQVQVWLMAVRSCFNKQEVKSLTKELNIQVSSDDSKEAMLRSLEHGVTTTKTLFGAPLSSRLPNLCNKVLKGVNEKLFQIIRLTPMVNNSLRRLQRLLQITSPSHTSVYQSTADPKEVNIPLMVGFGRMRFADYEVNFTERFFPTRRCFEQWEAANDLRAFLYKFESFYFQDLVQAYQLEFYEIMWNVVKAFDFQQELTTIPDQKFRGEAMTLSSFVKLLHKSLEKQVLDVSEASTLLGVASYVAYFKHKELDGGLKKQSSDATMSMSSESEVEVKLELATERPSFLDAKDCGVILSRICNEFISIFEKGNRDYELALRALNLQLSHTYLPHYRGRWYIRICTDLEHIGRHEESLKTAVTALTDASITVSDRLSLERRVKVLQKRDMSTATLTDSHTNSSEAMDSIDLGINSLIKDLYNMAAAPITHTAAPPSSSANKWTCSVCTFNNLGNRQICEMCGGKNTNISNTTVPIPTSSTTSNSSSGGGHEIICLDLDSDDDIVILEDYNKEEKEEKDEKKKAQINTSSKPEKKKRKAAKVSNNENDKLNSSFPSEEEPVNQDGSNDDEEDDEEVSDKIDLHQEDLVYLGLTPSQLGEAPKTLELYGKRWGDPTSRKGKNLFVGLDDELKNVESLVLDHLENVDIEDSEEFKEGIDSEGWQGKA